MPRSNAKLDHWAAVMFDNRCSVCFLLQFGAEFRRFSLDRYKPGKFEDFYKLILHIHHIANLEVMIGYADVHGDLLPINNDDNFFKAVSSAHPLLRVFIQRQGKMQFHFGALKCAGARCREDLWPLFKG